jgi:hypothetical protein
MQGFAKGENKYKSYSAMSYIYSCNTDFLLLHTVTCTRTFRDCLAVPGHLLDCHQTFQASESHIVPSKPTAMSHEEIWDDSALIDSWNDAVQEYKVLKPSSTLLSLS